MDFATLPNFKNVVIARDISKLTFGKVETAVGRVSFFDVHRHRSGPEFGVRYDHGGKRLCLSRDGATVVCACYEVYGLAAYDVAGAERWRRKDLRRVQFLRTVFRGDHVFCGRERGAGEILSISSGDTVHKFRGVREFFSSSFSTHVLLAGTAFELHADLGARLCKIQPQTFGVLDAAFTSQTIPCLLFAGSFVAFFQLEGGSR